MSEAPPPPFDDAAGSSRQAFGAAVFAAVLFLIFAGVFVESGNFTPEAGLFPKLIAIIAMAAAALAAAQSVQNAMRLRRDDVTARAPASERRWRELVVSYGGPPLFGVMTVLFGFWAAAALFLAGLLVILGTRSVLAVSAITGGTLLLIFIVFELVFGIRLPGSLVIEAFGR